MAEEVKTTEKKLEEKPEPKKVIVPEPVQLSTNYDKVYTLDQFLDYTHIKKAQRFYYEKLWGTPYIEQTLQSWSDTTGIKF
jgi:hypothetical protein